MTNQKIQQILINHSNYPELLKHIADAPAILYYKGNLNALNQTCLAIVGTRNNSEYGKRCTEKLVRELAETETTIISGLARGIDGIAHKAALKNGLKTVAVLAGGFNHLSPASHQNLAEKIIAEGGCLITEFSAQTPSFKDNFLKRNRIISGLSCAICVVECPFKSGAINTAYHAKEQNREVYTFPGDISREQSLGNLRLMQESIAQPISSAKDIFKDLEAYFLIKKKQKLASKEQKVFKQVTSWPKSIDVISQSLNMDAMELANILTILELKGEVIKTEEGYIRRL